MRIATKDGDIKRIRIHDLRHSHASLLIELVFSPVAIADVSFSEVLNRNKNVRGDEIGDDVVLKLIAEQPTITAKELSQQSSFSTRKISRIVKELRESGKITRVGSDRKGYWLINR